jgi:putative PIN family toxin of toxin-antitoxin system
MKQRIVLDTNCLISSLSKKSESYDVWKGLYEGRYVLCVSNSILEEYQEKIAEKTTPDIAENVIQYLINSENVELISTYYYFNLISADPDDNKFVDCAIAANATYIVSDDRHFAPLKEIEYPRLLVVKLLEFVNILKQSYTTS